MARIERHITSGVFRGDYTPGTAYKARDLVTSGGNLYARIADGTPSGGFVSGEWTEVVSAGGAGLPKTVVTKTSTYTAAVGDFVLADASSGAFTVTLPSAAVGDLVTVKKIDTTANPVSVAGTIDGDSAGASIISQHFGATFECTSTGQWKIVAPTSSGGSNGTNGANGADGKTVRSGTGAPSSGLGVDGDFYLRTDTNAIYGPKAAGSWGSPTSLVGPAGTNGANGAISQVQDEGSDLAVRGKLNFVGTGVTAVDDAGGGRTTVTILGGGGGVGASTPGYMPALNDLLAAAFDPADAGSNTAVTSGRVALVKVAVPAAITVTSIVLNVATAGGGLVSNQNFAAIFDPATPAASARLGLTADQSAVWNTNGVKTMAIAGGPVSISSSTGFVYVAILANQSGGTIPQFKSRSPAGGSAMLNLGLTAQRSRAASNATGQTSMPATLDLTTNSADTNQFWIGLV